MDSRISRFALAAAILLAAGSVDAQTSAGGAPGPTKPAPKSPAKPEVGPVEHDELDTFYLQDKQGRWIQVVKLIKLETFSALYEKWRHELNGELPAEEQPRFRFDQIQLNGEARGDTVDLTARFTIALLTNQLTRIPLGFGQSRLMEKAQFSGASEACYVEYDRAASEHVAWVKQDSRQCVLTIKLRAPLEQVGEVTRLKLQSPAAAISQFNLRVPATDLVLESGNSFTGKTVGAATVFSGPVHGDLDLAWRKPRAGGASPARILSANTQVRMHVSGQSLSAEASINVSCFTGAFNSFTVELPPGAEFVSARRTDADQPDVIAAVREAPGQTKSPAAKAGKPRGKLVDVSFPSTNEAVNVKLVASFSDPGAQRGEVELAGFAVVDARFDEGIVDVVVDREWSAEFRVADAERIDVPAQAREGEAPMPRAESAVARPEAVTARFRYYRQPYSLTVTVDRRRTRVTVEPVYVVTVDRDRVNVEARLSYFVRGTNAEQLEVKMPDWVVDGIASEPEGVIDLDRFEPEPTEPLSIPLATPSGQFQVTLTAHYDLAADATEITFDLPRPKADTVTPAAVVISPALNVQLTPRIDEMTALAVDLLPPQLTGLPENRQAPLHFRDRGGTEAARFLASFAFRSRSMSIVDSSRIDLDERQARVVQTLDYQISHEPALSLLLRVPRMVLNRDNLQISLDDDKDKKLVWADVPDVQDGVDLTRSTVRVDLPSGRIGACRLNLAYALQLPTLTAGKPQPFSAPLVLSVNDPATTVERRTSVVHAVDALSVENVGDAWQPDEDAALDVSDDLALVGPKDGRPLQLSLTLRQSQQQNSSIVRQAWVQTWLSSAGRRDRAVYRVSTGDRQLHVRLPPGAEVEYVGVDGHEVRGGRAPVDGELTIDLPAIDAQQQFVVEIWYIIDEIPGSRWGRTSLTLPDVAGAKWARRMYWQLAIPRDEHLLLAPTALTPELAWHWEPLLGELGFWDHRASLDQRDLEKWIGASQQDDLPSGTNQYLFSGFGLVDRVEFLRVGRLSLLAGLSLLTLVLGLLLIYVPLLRHPLLLLPLGLAVAVLGLLFPEPAIQAAQAAVLGASIALTAFLLNWLVARQRNERAVVRGTSRAVRDSSGVESRGQAEADSQVSTATALAIHVSDGDSPK